MTEIEWLQGVVSECIAETSMERFDYYYDVYSQYSDGQKEVVRELFLQGLEEKDAFVVLSKLLKYKKTESFQKIFLDVLLNAKEIDCLLQSTIYYNTLRWGEDFYTTRRKARRANANRIEEKLNNKLSYLPVKGRNRKRIVIVTNQFLTKQHSPTNILVNMIKSLTELEYEYLLFVCPCGKNIANELAWSGALYEKYRTQWEKNCIKYEIDGKMINGYQISSTEDNYKEYEMMMMMIHMFNPFFVLDLNTVIPITDLISKFTTVATMPMSVYCPVADTDILLRLDKVETKLEDEYKNQLLRNQSQIFLQKKLPVIVDQQENNVSRDDFHVPEGSFVLAIVGNRLSIEINDKLREILNNVMSRNLNVELFLVGGLDKTEATNFLNNIQNRIHEIGFQENLFDFYSIVNLYVNPFRQGGGFSGKMALLAGVPVLTTDEGDVAYNCGKDFSVPNEEYEMILEKYITDEEFYLKKKEQARKVAESSADDNMNEFVNYIINEITKKIE